MSRIGLPAERTGAMPPGEGATAVPVPAVLAVYVVQFAFGFLLAGLGPSLVLLARDLATPRESLAWVSAGFGAGLLVLGAVGKRLLQVGPLRLLRASAAIQGAGGVLLALATALRAAQAGALLLGLGAAATVIAAPVLLGGPGSAGRFSLAFGLNSLSGIVSPLAISAVDAATGHGRAALLVATAGLFWAALPSRGAAPAARAAPAGSPAPAASPPRVRALRAAARWWVCIVAAVSPEFAFVVWGAARLQDSGLGPAGAAAAADAFPLGMSLGRLVLVPRLLHRARLVPWGVALAAAGALVCALPLGPALVTAASAAAGLGISPLYPLTLDRLVRTPGLDPDRGSAVGALGSGTAVLFAPILLGLLARAVPLRLGFLAAVPLLLLVALLHARDRARAGATPPSAARPRSRSR